MPERPGPSVVVIMGPPGAGKSSALMALEASSPRYGRFSVRDYGLHLYRSGDDLGQVIGPMLEQRLRLPDDLVKAELVHYLRCHEGVHRVELSESYPRGAAQCVDAEKVVADVGGRVLGLLTMDAPDEVVRERSRWRLTCTSCGRPERADAERRCTFCSGWAARRSDDEPESFAHRLRRYRREAAEVEAFYGGRGAMTVVDAAQDGPTVLADVTRAIEDLLSKAAPA